MADCGCEHSSRLVHLQVVHAHADVQHGEALQGGRRLRTAAVPLSATFALYSGRLVSDPTAEEEELAGSLVSVTTGAGGCLLGEGGWLSPGAACSWVATASG